MDDKLTILALQQRLKDMGRQELENLIYSLFQSSSTTEQAISLELVGEKYGERIIEQYKKRVYKIFHSHNLRRDGFSLELAQMELEKFAEVCMNGNDKLYGEMSLYFAECATDFVCTYSCYDDDLLEALGDAYHDVTVIASENKSLFELWKDRIWGIYNEFSVHGSGLEDEVCEDYYSIPWVSTDRVFE